jgi:putative DNA primase/helicase
MRAALNWTGYQVGDHRIECPSCGRGERDKTAGLKIEHDRGVVHCFRCDYTESFSTKCTAVHRVPAVRARHQVEKHHVLSDWGRGLWGSTQELDGVALQYLESRRCCVPPAYGDLRWHPALKHPSGYVGTALVGLITDAHTCKPLSLHRTWITATGKADVDPARLLLANHAIAGGVIRLTPDDDVNALLGIAEGIETALSLAWAPMPVWAVIDAGHLAKFPVLAGITTLVISQDQDIAGATAAARCAQRWAQADREVLVTRQIENDLNDSLRASSK